MSKFSAMALVVCGFLSVSSATTPVHSAPLQTHSRFGVSARCDDDPNYTIGGDNGNFNFGHKDWIGIIGSGNTVVANTCDVLVINGDRNTVTIQGGACKYIYNSGNHNKIIVQGSCQLLRMDWDHNAVIANELGTIQLIGSHNAVTANIINPTIRPTDVLKSGGGVAVGRHHLKPQPDPDLQNLLGVVIRGNSDEVALNSGHCDTIKTAGQSDTVSLGGSCQNVDVTSSGQSDTIKIHLLSNLQVEGKLNTFDIEMALDPNAVAMAVGGSIGGSGNVVLLRSGKCVALNVPGRSNNVTMQGYCMAATSDGNGNSLKVDALDSLLVRGNHNSINIDKAGGGEIAGNDNTVIYQHGVGRGKITIAERFKVTGQRDTVKRVTS